MLNYIWTFLQGKKTYIVALGTLVYAGLGLYFHFLTLEQAMPYILSALGAIGLRSAIQKLM